MELTFELNIPTAKWKKGKFIVENLTINMSNGDEPITFDDIKLFLDDKPYDNSIEAWAGYKLKPEHLFEACINSYIAGNKDYSFSDEWKIFNKANSLKEEQAGLITRLPFYYCGEFLVYKLEYATSKFRYYQFYDNPLMLDTEGRVKTDVEAFYMQALYDDICKVINGEERCLYKDPIIDLIINDAGGEQGFLDTYGEK